MYICMYVCILFLKVEDRTFKAHTYIYTYEDAGINSIAAIISNISITVRAIN